jgi:hypothetical protein
MAEQEFTEKPISPPKFRGVGKSGTLITADVVENDYISALNGIEGQETFAKMLLSDSQIRKLYHAVSNPVKSATWDIEPVSADKRNMDAAALMKQILFKDMPEGFISKLDEILTFPWHGHAVFEPIHANRNSKAFGSYTGLLSLAYRDQRTLDKWKHEDGILKYIHQIQNGDNEVDVDIPAEELLIFYNEKKGNDTGYPFCRMLYGNYKRKLLYKQLQAIGIERAAIPVPHLGLPEGVDYDSPEYADAIAQLASFTQAEQAFFVTPIGYTLNYYQTGTYDPSKVQTAIKAENEEISGSLIGMWLEMGIGGNSAVGSSTGISSDFFKDGIEYIADKIADVFNLQLIPHLMRLNYGDEFDPSEYPTLTHNGIADEAGKELMEVVTGYAKASLITPDELLEDHIRKIHNLPKKVQGEAIENQAVENENDDDPIDDVVTVPVDDPNDVELAAKTPKSTPRTLISGQGVKISSIIKDALDFSAAKYINDVMVKHKQLPDTKKQNATNKVKIAGVSGLRTDLKRSLAQTVTFAVNMARTEIPNKKDIELKTSERDMLRMKEMFDTIDDVKLNDFSKIPGSLQVLIAKQADLISADSLAELKKRLDFTFSSIETKVGAANIIRQAMEDEAEKFATSNQITIKGNNSSALMVNEGRDTFFFNDDVLEEIHSFTFVNAAPKSLVCIELAGTTFKTNDAESLRYSPPLHHNCKSYLRANLKVSKGLEGLNVQSLSPSAASKKSITL